MPGAGRAALDDGPGIAGRRGLVHDQRGGGALSRGLFELVGPAPVVGHRVTAKQLGVLGREARVVDKDDGGLAGHVHAGVVVPVVLGGHDAIADEHQLAVVETDRFGHVFRPDDRLGAMLDHLQRLAVATEHERLGVGGDGDQRYVLEIAVAVARGQAGGLELLGEVGQRLGLAGRGRAAALERVRRERLDVPAEGLLVDVAVDRRHGLRGDRIQRHGVRRDRALARDEAEGRRRGDERDRFHGRRTPMHDALDA